MIIIGEKINGTLKPVKQALSDRDPAYIAEIARQQAAAGAHFLDVNAGTAPEREPDDLKWLLEIIQSEVDTPICLDSPRSETLAEVLPHLKRPGLINSVTDEEGKPDRVLSLAKEHNCGVIALTLDQGGIPADAETRLGIAARLIDKATAYGIPGGQIYVDPLVVALSTNHLAGQIFIRTVELLRSRFPEVKTVSGLSNISFGMPNRKLVNRMFLALALAAGMEAAILDPLDRELISVIYATDALLGRDQYSRNYIVAHRKGLLV